VLLVLLLLVGAGLLIWFFISQGDDGASQDGGAAAEGTLTTSEGTDVLAAASGGSEELAAFEDQTVRGQGVEVQSVISDEAFWLGGSEAQRVFVVSSGQGESPANVDAGDRVDVSGVVRVLPVDYEQRFGLSADEGSADLVSQGHYVEALSLTETGS
jgi:hypothetical protein